VFGYRLLKRWQLLADILGTSGIFISMSSNLPVKKQTGKPDLRPGHDASTGSQNHISGAGQSANAHSIPPSGMPGYALLNQRSGILFASTDFSRLLDIDIENIQLSLLEKLEQRYPENANEFAHALGTASSNTIDVQTSTTEYYRLNIAALESNRRLIVVEPIKSDNTDVNHINLSLVDPLTQLGNRRQLDQFLEKWQRATVQQSAALLMMDLDRFKIVNDTLGHGMGDALLKLVAKRASRVIREGDILVRLGGDEFVIVHAVESQSSAAEEVAQRLVEVMSRPFLVDGHQIGIGASIGIAVLGHDTKDVADLMRHADLALYETKSQGRGAYCFFNQSMEQRAIKRRDLETSLRRAIGLKQFSLMYQPQVKMPQGTVTGFEALIRWNHEALGLISPIDFIPLAEETGEILAIGEWVLRTACKEATTWPDHLSVAVNVSPLQFESEHFVDSIRDVLTTSGLQPSRLEIEITETVLINNPETVLQQLHNIQDMGVSIAMDDFGTGYSSLSTLNNFPLSKIKIDQAFVRGEQNDKSRALINAIISLGVNLGMDTLAEGVETEDQYKQLADDGCSAAQGYLISKPMHAESITDFLSDQIGAGTKKGT